MFFTLSKTKIINSGTFNLSSANAFNLDQSKMLSFGKESRKSLKRSDKKHELRCMKNGLVQLRKVLTQISLRGPTRLTWVNSFCYRSIFCMLTHSHTRKPFDAIGKRAPMKTLWEKEKLLVTSDFSLTHSVFYQFRELSAIYIKFKIIVCRLFQFGPV